MVFIDLKKTYDKIPRNVMWWALDKHKVPSKYVTLIKDMYNNGVTSVRTNDGTQITSRLKLDVFEQVMETRMTSQLG